MKFVDTATIHVRGGDGGSGAVSFRREKHVPKGGPDGGDGGNGGDVVIEVDSGMATLMDFRYQRHYRAEDGRPGSGANKSGKSGEAVHIRVPPGTAIHDHETGELLADLVDEHDKIIVARGGIGGRGNSAFATSTNRAPRSAENGRPGEEREIDLELKLLADVGIVGLPNAGKSTLISRVSGARPKIAEYPFTTLVPNLGIVRLDASRSFVIADIPGLIEGAGEGKGLGHEFLRHVERSGVLCFLLDGAGSTPAEDFAALMSELTKHSREMVRKPRLIAISKSDIMTPQEKEACASLSIDGRAPVLISAVSGEGIEKLLGELYRLLGESRNP